MLSHSISQNGTQVGDGTYTMYVYSITDAVLTATSAAIYYLYIERSPQLYGTTDALKADRYVFHTIRLPASDRENA